MANAPIFTRGNFSDFFGASMLPVLEEVFKSELELYPMLREQLFKTVKTDRDIYQSSEIHDMPLFTQMDEGADYSYSRPRQGAHKTITVNKFGLGFSISEEAIQDGRFDFVSDAVRKMAESARESQEVQGINLLNNAFSTTTVANGAALCSTSQTLPSGLTWRNRPSSDVDLSPSALDSALVDFATQPIGDSGIYKMIQPKILLVPKQLERYAKQIVGSELQADTADNNMNALKQEGLRVVASPHLTDTVGWFLLADKEKTGLRIISREGIQTKSEQVFSNDSVRYKSRYREAVSALHGYGIWGTAGV
jgi:hypothetical protein